METKRPFARVAGWAAWWLAVAAVTAAVVTALVKPPPEVSQPSAFELALLTLSALGVFACLLASLLCGAVALWGVRQHGRRGILAPALCGMALAVAMLVPVVWGMFSSFAVQARQVKASEATTLPVVPARPK
jgi:hypothetical protein